MYNNNTKKAVKLCNDLKMITMTTAKKTQQHVGDFTSSPKVAISINKDLLLIMPVREENKKLV